VTRLPLDSRDVRGISGPPRDIPEVCHHPECEVRGRRNLELHEMFPRWFLRKQPIEYVQLPSGLVLPNQIYLGGPWTCGHHQQITENKARILWDEDFGGGVFQWVEWAGPDPWAAPLDPQPEVVREAEAA
jgi:hypothetical protein